MKKQFDFHWVFTRFYLFVLGFITVIMTILLVLKYSGPTMDGDVYFHTAYGKIMWEKKSLRFDENIFTWKGYSDVGLYPAWIPQLIFYGLYKLGGDDVVFIYSLRLFLVFLFIILALIFCYELKVKYSFSILFLVSSAILLARNGLMLKADMFSVLFFGIFMGLYLYGKYFKKPKLFWGIPLVFLLWANSHIGVVMGFFALASIFLIEALFYRQEGYYKVLAPVLLFSFVAMFITPKPLYHWQMIKSKFIEEAIGRIVGFRKDLESPVRYILALKPLSWNIYIDYTRAVLLNLLFLLFLFGLRCYGKWRQVRGEINWIRRMYISVPWDILLLTFMFFRLTDSFARLSYTFGITAMISGILLISEIKRLFEEEKVEWIWHLRECIAIICTVSMVSPLIYGLPDYRFCGDGGWVPVMEVEYLKKALPKREYKVINTYGIGSYLMLKGYPEFKVFIDTRMGKNFMNYYNFIRGLYEQMDAPPQEISKDADIAILSYRHWEMIRWFLDNPHWRVIFWGPAAVVLINKERMPDIGWHNPDWDKFKHNWIEYGGNEFTLVRFLLYSGHLEEAKKAVEIAYKIFPQWKKWKSFWNTVFLAETDYSYGYRTYISSSKEVAEAPAPLRVTVLYLARKHAHDLFQEGKYSLALKWEQFIYRYISRIDISLYNQGILWYALNKPKDARAFFVGAFNYNKYLPYKEFVNCVMYNKNPEIACANYEYGFWDEVKSRLLRKEEKDAKEKKEQ